ncbi:MAG: hypothetical protein FWE91_11320 [Defluviitaleaceae bacterium]|nr:hypothetical protein [Defluviitaleaceae bacterium]MCL2837125.1 hypothetical protein [Defluviitaleaceae bacterium]
MKIVCDGGFDFPSPIAVSIGNFDGLHTGHLRVLEVLRRVGEEAGQPPAVMSFYPHPLKILGSAGYKTLLTREEKTELLAASGIDFYIEYPFDRETAQMTPWDFVRKVLRGKLNTGNVVVGEGWRFGAGASGNVTDLRKIGAECGITVTAVAHNGVEGLNDKISSSIIKGLLQKKDFTAVTEYLTREYFITIIKGKINPEKILPPDGGYAVKITAGGTTYMGKAHVRSGGIRLEPDLSLHEDARVAFIKPLC